MSGILNEAFTPCPLKTRSPGFSEHSGSEIFDSVFDGDSPFETTEQVDFTTEVRAPILTGVRPRRANRAGNTFQIHDDFEKPTNPAEKRRRPNATTRAPSERKLSVLAQPAQRFRPKVHLTLSVSSRPVKREIDPPPKEPKICPNLSDEPSPATQTRNTASSRPQNIPEAELRKHVRRNTVYIPPDDTTVASVFMGLFSPLKKSKGNTSDQLVEDTQVDVFEAKIIKQQARKSLAVSARRPPLQPSAKIAQEAAQRVDVAGKNGGKENVPPGTFADIEKQSFVISKPLSKPKRISSVSAFKPAPTTVAQQVKKSDYIDSNPTIVEKQPTRRDVLGEKQNNVKLFPAPTRLEGSARPQQRPLANHSASLNARASALSERLSRSESLHASRIESVSAKLKQLNNQFPILTENISKPALYEENWLSHQETVISQLVNALFECSDRDSDTFNSNELRLELLQIYHTDYFAQLHQRLQASLSCGILSIPRDTLVHANRLKQDVGLKRKFLDIWIQSYDLYALAAAAETVVGRKVFSSSAMTEHGRGPSIEDAVKFERTMTRKLERFLDTFLLRNDDLGPSGPSAKETSPEIQAKIYRRTVLRSILIVVLLDHGKQSSGVSLPRKLFPTYSSLKSSAEVIQALARLLLPSCGDIIKPLLHLGCQLSYKQHLLQEYDYQMHNLAVDLRDGVRLTRIVEVLFFTSAHVQTLEDQTEVTLSTGESVSLLGNEKDLPLSKHLKYPCASRVAKLHNVRVALSALNTVQGSGTIVGSIRPEDIVDGYREKTIALLWALVSKWGLVGLVDWHDVDKEIMRLKRKAALELGYDRIKDDPSFTCEHLHDKDKHIKSLQQWAGILATLNGLHIDNMTTSFADGQLYGSIVDEYEPYITGGIRPQNLQGGKQSVSMTLESRLRLLGCSSQYACLVSPGIDSPHFLDDDFTLGALAFLCSRLLSASKRPRAATVLQRAWRAHLAKRDENRRAIARNLAAHCAIVVQTRNEILWAKEVITRYWRMYQARKRRPKAIRAQSSHIGYHQSRKNPKRRL
ncbi:hypothetical protein N7462_003087 [Penicillium macrosclerotiorum]|uniref:uncharacterized protein n=1 Tax=Penicillium macrosclerotiorum TaxID=303699 RepID=UPI00254941CC|nr:uncharacterized protein N7462_003087 [Penicillium macrosclerotiorum]KAJ5688695.1 hypothetical protein N7462_003087 [Penicillium macrosclerotiorum]